MANSIVSWSIFYSFTFCSIRRHRLYSVDRCVLQRYLLSWSVLICMYVIQGKWIQSVKPSILLYLCTWFPLLLSIHKKQHASPPLLDDMLLERATALYRLIVPSLGHQNMRDMHYLAALQANEWQWTIDIALECPWGYSTLSALHKVWPTHYPWPRHFKPRSTH